ncbi:MULTISPECIES: HAMP domain-containing sensor histidine kinase [unclassified Micromonospora]|uniref:sensor histidine kinase n=1 Tax=unclassified Micromonospora TaxID=2617518 RepID=UPI00103344D7|nr:MULTISPECIES: HAMP domain-containing sensor histidine kinase [unclassified Micromonospora]QKW12347.1 HAMP domain-containing histidine kinase [Verrucosispora sp. NA02020]TBL27858.1 HAMP domain-containing histidine kinase [Verrucosispora sp. SN26_14.1]
MTPRRRIVLVGVVALIAGYALPGLTVSVTSELWWRVRGLCDSGLSGSGLVCEPARGLGGVALSLLGLVVFLLAVAAVWVAAGWCLRPVRDLAGPISHAGPQNLGHRIRMRGNDEVARLARSIDEMMERIAAGYEGQRRFAANASHELRTPLAVQRTLIEVGLSRSLSGEQMELVADQLLETNERNERLIEGLLALSESDQGLRSRLPQRLDEIVTEVLAAYQDRITEAGVTVSTHLEPRTVMGERVLLERLVTNLLENAIKYNRQGGAISVTVGRNPALTVVNTGQVVPAEAVAGLFEPFRRLARDRTNQSGGAGLGLAIARSITQAHDGLIAARPAEYGGLRVDVQLPHVP